MVALDLAVQLVLARKPADRRFIHLQPTTGGAARTLETQGTLASGQLGAGSYQLGARTSCGPRIENLDSRVLPLGTLV